MVRTYCLRPLHLGIAHAELSQGIAIFQLEASSFTGNIVAYFVSSLLMEQNPWIAVLLGLGLCLAALLASLFIPIANVPNEGPLAKGTEAANEADGELVGETDIDGSSQEPSSPKSARYKLRLIGTFIKEKRPY